MVKYRITSEEQNSLFWLKKYSYLCAFLFFFLSLTSMVQAKDPDIPHTNWSLRFVDSQETSCGGNWAAVNSFDGNTATFWHTQFCTTNPPPPHEIQINLGAVYSISGFRYLPRQDGSQNGWIGQYEFYVSSDGVNWGTAVATGTFAKDVTEKEVLFSSTTGQYVRLRALTEVNGNPWTSAAEINVEGVSTQPNAVINSPSGDMWINVGDTVNFTGAGNDPGGNLPLSYLWNFGDPAIPNSTAQNPGNVQFNNAGTYTVSFTVTNSLNVSSPPATRTIRVGTTIIPQTNLSLRFVDSQETSCGNWAAVNSFDGNTATFWHTQFCTTNPPPPHEIQINLGAVYSISGFRYLPRQDGSQNGWIGNYAFYVSSDGVNWGTAVATGTFAKDATQKEVLFSPMTGQYVRLRALTEVNGNPWTSAAEINVEGTLSTQPVAVINSPSGNMTINVGDMVNFTGAGSDPAGLPLSYLWNFGDPAIPNSTSQNPGNVQFNNPGTYTVTFTVTNSSNVSSTPATRTITVKSGQTLPQNNWSLKFVDSQETSCGNWAAVNSFDGNTATFWHTQFCTANPPPPHEIQINLGGAYVINGFRYLPRQDGSQNGWIGNYAFYVSSDGVNWGTAVATGTFAKDATQKQVLFPVTTGQYVRLRALTEVNGNPWTSAAEINVLESGLQIVSPSNLALKTSPNVLVQALTTGFPSNWTVKFVLDGASNNPLQGGACNPPSAQQVCLNLTGLSLAEHTVDAQMLDQNGVPQPFSDHVGFGVGDYYVGFGDSITRGSHDDILTDNTSADGRNTGGGYEPILNTRLTHVKGYPQSVVNAGESGDTTSAGLSRVSTVLGANPDSNFFLIMFGTNDADSTLPLPSGLGLSPGQAGYAGSYKDYMQQIVTAVIQGGKNPLLAKIPMLRGDCSTSVQFSDPSTAPENIAAQQYGQVVDELRAADGIIVPAPDFYSYFSTHLTEYADNCHPNGTGYKSMARLWCQSITGLTGTQCDQYLSW